MDIHKLVWDKSIPFVDRLANLSLRKAELNTKITNYKKLPFDIYYKFSNDSRKLTANNEWKQVELAIKVLKIVKRWDRIYKIDLKKKMDGEVFVNYFKSCIDISKFNLCTIGINFYHQDGYTFKTFIIWANKLCKLGVISDVKFNSFMSELEGMSTNE